MRTYARRALVTCFVASALAALTVAGELHVPADFDTIQAAVNAAVDGDSVVVAPGTYSQAINLLGKQIIVRSSHGSEVTFLDGDELNTSIIRCISGETLGTAVEGFTLQNGRGRSGANCATSGGNSGGAIFIGFGGLTVRDCNFVGNGTGIRAGGAIEAYRSDLRVEGCTFLNNGQDTGYGGAVNQCSGTLDILNCTFIGNGPSGHGGAVLAASTAGFVSDSTFIQNNGGHGGGLRLSGAASAVQNCEFTQNYAAHGAGANISAETASVVNCHFTLNEASHGGGLVVQTPTRSLVVDDCTFAQNMAAFGGGLNVQLAGGTGDPVRARIHNCEFTDNAGGFAGGMLGSVMKDGPSPGPEMYISGCRFTGNSALGCCDTGIYGTQCFTDGSTNDTYFGGAADLRAFYGGLLEVTNCVVAGNSATLGGGFHLATCGGGVIRTTNCTIADNEPTGLHLRLGSAGGAPALIDVSNSIVWSNGAPGSDQILVQIKPVSAIHLVASVRYSAVEGGFEGDGNVNVDPLFVDAAGGDYSLLPQSPCIDAGENASVPADLFDLDGDGDTSEPLPWDLAGGARFRDVPAIPDTGSGDPPLVDLGAYEVQAACNGCDTNCDGSVNQFDITSFVALLIPPAPPACSPCAGDADGNATVNQFDIGAFLACLTP